MLDLGLIKTVSKVYAEKPRTACSIADVLAVIDKESHGVPVFRGSDPLFRMNLNMVLHFTQRNYPAIREPDIRRIITIPDGPLKHQWCKFRFEQNYFGWARQYASGLLVEHCVLLSCSVGLGQQMLRYVVQGLPALEGIEVAYKFMGDVSEQIRWVIGNLEQNHSDDKRLQFARYNGGPSVKVGGKVYSTYGNDVFQRSIVIAQELKERGHASTIPETNR